MREKETYINRLDKYGVKISDGDIIKITSRGIDFICYIDITSSDIIEPYDNYSKEWEHMLYSPDWDNCEIIGKCKYF